MIFVGKIWVAISIVIFLYAGNACSGEVTDHASILAKEGEYEYATQLLEVQLGQHPEDVESRFLLARVLSWSGRYEVALEHYNTLLQIDGDNTDYLFGKAQVYFWMGKHQEALDLLETIRQKTPSFQDVWRLELNILVSGKAAKKGLSEERFRVMAAEAFPDATWWKVEKKPSSTYIAVAGDGSFLPSSLLPEIEAGFRYDYLNNGFANWNSYYLSVSKRFANDVVLYGTAEQTRRFNLRDYQFIAGVYLPVSSSATLLMEGQFSPSHKVLPSSSLLGMVLIDLSGGWGTQLGVRQTHYPSVMSWTYTGMLERYFGDFRGSYAFNWVNVKNAANGSNHVFSLDYYYGETSSAGVVYTIGEEVERVGPAKVLITPIWNVTGRGHHWFSERWGTSWSLHFHHQGNIYNNIGGSIGLLHRF